MNNLINEDIQAMKYLFDYQKGKVISEQHQPKNFSVNQVVNAKRDIDGQMYTIKITRAEPNFMVGTVTGPGDYSGTSLKNGQSLELYSDAPGVLAGNSQLGKFTVVAQPSAATANNTQTTGNSVDLIKKIQTVLKDKYKAQLGGSGPNKDGVDGKWGNLTQTALENAVKTMKGATVATPQVATPTTTPTAPTTTGQEQSVSDVNNI